MYQHTFPNSMPFKIMTPIDVDFTGEVGVVLDAGFLFSMLLSLFVIILRKIKTNCFVEEPSAACKIPSFSLWDY